MTKMALVSRIKREEMEGRYSTRIPPDTFRFPPMVSSGRIILQLRTKMASASEDSKLVRLRRFQSDGYG